MDRPLWKSRRGEPLSVTELALIRLVVTLTIIGAMAWVTYSVSAGFCVGLAVYLLLDRAQILLGWAVETRARRRADARMLATLRQAPARAHMAVRP